MFGSLKSKEIVVFKRRCTRFGNANEINLRFCEKDNAIKLTKICGTN